jgi:ATP-binding cassette subfamily C protein
MNWQESTAQEQVRLQHKATGQREALEGAVARLAGLLEPAIAPPEGGSGAPDPLLHAARLVGQAQGIEIVPPVGRRATTPEDALHQIARASRIRLRQVALAGNWWRHVNGPLLAFRAATGLPVALLMPAPGAYTLIAPGEPGRLALDRTVAATLAPFGYAFYRPFPAQVVTVWDVLRFGLHGSGRDLRTIAGLGLLMGLLGLLTPVATGLIVDWLIPGAERNLLVQVGGGLLVVAFATALFQVTRSIAMLRVEGKADATVQAAVWDRLLSLPVPFFRDYTSGDLAMRAMGITTIRQILSGTVLTTILTSLFSVFNLALLFYYHAALALVATGLVFLSMIVTFLAGTLQLRQQRRLVAEEGQIAGLILQLINGIAKFRVAGAEARAFALWAARFSRQRALAYQARAVANHLGVFNLVYPLLTAIVIFGMVSVTRVPGFTTGRFLAFNVAFAVLLVAGLRLSEACLTLLSIVPLYERAKPILQTLPEGDAGKSDPGEMTGEIEVSQVSFRYKVGGALILKEVSLHIQPGEFVALVGPSGSGKSTLLRLLLGFETPESGGIYYDGRDLAGLDPRAVRQQIGVVLQNGQLLAGDIFQNILGGAALTLDAAWAAARQAGLDDEIRAMPMGMHTVISEGGGTLSGGQRQRLLIARALVKRPRILFFDEATSALDNRTQDIISRSLLDLQATRVVIAHRLSTILSADRIVVLDAGRVVQAGTYSELIDQPGLFADLAKRQML